MNFTFDTAYDTLAELTSKSNSTLNLLAQAALVNEKQIEQDMFLDQQHDEKPASLYILKERAKSNLADTLGTLLSSLQKAIDDLDVNVEVRVKRSVSYRFDFRDGGPLR